VTTNTHEASPAADRGYRVPAKSPWTWAWMYPGWVGALGAGIAAYGWWVEPHRFPFSYLFGFFVALSLPLGAMFWVLVLYVSKASWGITVRRVTELFFRPMWVFSILVIPLILQINSLFPWAGAPSRAETSEEQAAPLVEARGVAEKEPAALRDLPVANAKRSAAAAEAAEAQIVNHKRPWLNRTFFLIRLFVYLIVWSFIAQRYFWYSTEQDTTRDRSLTAAAQNLAPAGLIVFGLTLTFFSFDWLLSLDATWYSTIFGVQVFAQCALVQMAALVVATLMLRKGGLLGQAVTVEHYHDMGKLLFGFIAFWSYITFAQFFLTWYSNIPDEVTWFHKRWDGNGGTWQWVSLLLVVMHFFVPFWFLMSRNIKRRLSLLAAGATCMLVMHVVEVYWIIMPNIGPLQPSLLDLGCLLGVLGIYLAAVLYGIEEHPLIPVGDPRLVRALEFENA
jgi:hypothetical protein